MNTKTARICVFLAAIVVLCVAGTKISRMTETPTIQGDSLFVVVTGSVVNGTVETRSIQASNLLSALTNFPGWPAGGSGGSATNAISTFKTNGTTMTTAATSLDIIQGSNTVVRATNASGVLTLQINSAAGTASVNTNLQLQSLKVFGNQTNVASQYYGTNYAWTDSGVNTLQLIDSQRGGSALTFEGSDGGITLGLNGSATPYIDVVGPMITYSHFKGQGTNFFSGAVRLPGIATNGMLFLDGNSNVVKLGVGSGLSVSAGNLTATGGGGGGGGGPASYVALPTSGIIGGTQYGYVTNLTANQMLIVSNLTADLHYFVDVKTAGYVASISNYQSIYPMDAQLGGIASLSTNGVSTVEFWKDSVSGNTNMIVHGPEFALVAGWGKAFVTNNLTRTLTVVQTNNPASIATNATSVTVDFGDTANTQIYNAWFHLTTNLVVSPTNLVTGRTLEIYFATNSLTYDVVITNTAANPVKWNFNVATNGSTSFTKTNSLAARAFLTAETNGTITAEMGYYR